MRGPEFAAKLSFDATKKMRIVRKETCKNENKCNINI
jgi:hypothetical protein